jgi:hypothetical protein
MRNVRTPRFLDNLYRDMRDRRLLFPAVALLVALIAVPVLLKSSTPTPSVPAASAAAAGGGDQSAVEPAVLAEQAGITDYRKRLDWLQSKNPFRSRVPVASPGGGGGGGSGSTAPTDTGLGTTATSTTSTTAPSTTPTGSSSSSSASAAGAPASSGGTSAGSKSAPKPGWYAFRVAVAVGPAGNVSDRNSVERLTFLPSKNRPVVAFIGVSEDGKAAVFMVSDDVSSVEGEGRCIPRRSDCQFVELKPGEKASFRYEPEGNRKFNLRLRTIELVPVGKIHATVHAKTGTEPLLGPDG